ncbi:MAG TPA: VWA domain-containing protein [Candidatus Binatia bacterium]|jgi:uncharacterized protein with von Willebrand factor type A (vWA) domain|nr:VWA domain-containing protein [Candidatus Binatia bacterium]
MDEDTLTSSVSDGSGQLLHNLVLFGRLLRRLGIDVNPGRMIELVQALDYVNLARRDDFYHTIRSLLVHRHDQLPLFDRAFELFWRRHNVDGFDVELFDAVSAKRSPKLQLAHQILAKESEHASAEPEDELDEVIEIVQSYSERERLREKDFGELTKDEVESVRRFMSELVWQLGQKRTRRFRRGRSARLDLRRLMRRNLRFGGELLELPTRQQKVKPRQLVIVADVSGSMQNYTRLLLYFVYSLLEGLSQKVEAFVFSTRLSRITRELRSRELDEALERVARSVPDWSGGTRIGDALKVFNFRWGRRVLAGGAVVILISDGWDRGDPELLAEEMARLQRSCHRLIWLNPLLGSPAYEPLTRGMQAALPYVDDFLPVHNLASLEDLGRHLEQLGREPSPRQQRARAAMAARALIDQD